MIDGLWHFRYVVAGKEFGGVLVLRDGQALGGDGGFIYKGTLQESKGEVTGELHIRQVMKSAQPAFRGLTDYRLKLSGTHTKESMAFVGEPIESPGVSFKIAATRYAP